MKPEDKKTEERDVGGWKIKIRTYRLGDTFYCHIDNVDPGATIARSQAATEEEARDIALQKAESRLARTKPRS